MNESALESLVVEFLAGIRRAFADVKKKDAATHDMVMQQLNYAISEADKIRREEASKQQEVADAKELQRMVRAEAVQSKDASPSGEFDKVRILSRIHGSPSIMKLVTKQSQLLVERGLSDLVTKQVDQLKGKIKPDDGTQGYFEFHKQFSYVRQATFSYIDPDTKKPVRMPITEGRKKDWAQGILQSKRDTQNLIKANAVLEPLREIYGDLPGPELLGRQKQDQQTKDRVN